MQKSCIPYVPSKKGVGIDHVTTKSKETRNKILAQVNTKESARDNL